MLETFRQFIVFIGLKMTIAHNATNNPDVNEVLQGLVDLFEATFPGRIHGYYLEGSYADQTALSTSDIDIIVLFKNSFVDERERESAVRIAERYSTEVNVELDIGFMDENQIANGVPPALKLGSTVLFGEPVRDDLPLVSIADWERDRMHVSYWLMTKHSVAQMSSGVPAIIHSPVHIIMVMLSARFGCRMEARSVRPAI